MTHVLAIYGELRTLLVHLYRTVSSRIRQRNGTRAELILSTKGKTHTGEVFSLLLKRIGSGFSVIWGDGQA
jgi:predicted metal-dependent peptidase